MSILHYNWQKAAAKLVALDFAWALLSWGLVAASLWPLTTTGGVLVVLVADIVLIFGLVQAWGLRRVRQQQAA